MANQWFRMYYEFASDPVIQSLAFEDQRHFVVLLCLKCQGVLDRNISNENRERIICRGLGLDPMAANEAKRRLVEVGLIETNWQISAWDRRQYVSDNSTERVRKYRKNKESGNVSGTFQKRTRNRTETDTDKEKELTTVSSQKKFIKPTVEQVAEYVAELGCDVSPSKFVDYYESKGWVIGKSPMKDWKAAVRNWRKTDDKKPKREDPQAWMYEMGCPNL